MIEDRLGVLGRPFTTAIVVVVGLGVMAWGIHMVMSRVVVPIGNAIGATFDPELVSSFVTLAVVLLMVVVTVVATSAGLSWTRLARRTAPFSEDEVERLRAMLGAVDREP